LQYDHVIRVRVTKQVRDWLDELENASAFVRSLIEAGLRKPEKARNDASAAA
jgi:hypothetical protein